MLRTGRAGRSKASPYVKISDAFFTVTTLPVEKIVADCADLDARRAMARRAGETIVHLTKLISRLGVKAGA